MHGIVDHRVSKILTKNQEFLTNCIGTYLKGNTLITLKQTIAHDKLDWAYILQQSELHRVSGILFEMLRNIDRSCQVPIEVVGKMREHYYRTVTKNLAHRSELRKILNALRKNNIDTIVLKGAALAELAYESIGFREMLDIDILVKPEKAMSAYAAVENLGYSPKEDAQKQIERRLHHGHLSQLFGIDSPCIVEIHTNIIEANNPLRFDVNGFWDRAVEVDIAGTRAKVLGPVDQLIHLAIHFFRDRRGSSYSALSQLLDMSLVIRQAAASFDWTLLVHESTSKGITGPVFLGLYLAKELLHAEIPETVLESLRPKNFKKKDADRFIRQRIFGQKAFVKSLFDPKDQYRWRSIPLAVLKHILQKEYHGVPSSEVGAESRKSVLLGLSHYLNEVMAKIAIVRSAISHPIRLFEDVASDKLLHSLYSAGQNATNGFVDSAASTEQAVAR